MRTLLTALAAYSGCAAARRYLDRPGRPERDYLGGRVRRKPLWNEGAAEALSPGDGADAGRGPQQPPRALDGGPGL